MNDDDTLASIARLAGTTTAPHAGVLTPEVRSGSSFALPPGVASAATDRPPVRLVWVYRVTDATAFAVKVAALEGALPLPGVGTAVVYQGTYSVTVSSAAPEFEYRTFWGLENLAALQQLNDLLHAPPVALADVLKLIAPTPTMRTEIMGATRGSRSLVS